MLSLKTWRQFGACAFAYCLVSAFAHSAEVSPADAQEAVSGWAALREALGEQFKSPTVGVATYDGEDGLGKFHVVSFEGGGFAVTSGDTEITPILAYSPHGEFAASEENPLWGLLVHDVAGRTRRLGAADSGEAEDEALAAKGPAKGGSRNASAWERLRNAAAKPTRQLLKVGYAVESSVADMRVAPLCATRWSQADANGGNCYNYYTPSNYVCGCVATAMAQVMKFFEWPKSKVEVGDHWYIGRVTPQGASATTWRMGLDPDTGDRYDALDPAFTGPGFGGPYDWANMPALPSQVVSDAQRQAIGQLTRDCGISLRVKYAPTGSSASGYTIKLRLVDQFGYANADVIYKKGNAAEELSPEEARRAMLSNFDFGLPCAVDIAAPGGGHEIVGDGYGYSGDRLYIHFNFGWGEDASTAWYTPSDSDESDLSSIKGIVYNIWTPEMCAETNLTIVSGRVLDADGEPVAGLGVTATDKKTGATFSATSGEKGIYALLLPPETTYRITASKDGCSASATRRVERCISNPLREYSDGSVKYGYNYGETVANQPGVDLVLAEGASDDPWLDESAATKQHTGEWSEEVSYDEDGRAYLYCRSGDIDFIPYASSTGNVVTVETKALFGEYPGDDAPGASVQAAVRIGTNGCFQAWANGAWADAVADGFTPENDVEYALRLTLDYTAHTYSVEAKKSGSAEFTRLGGDFPIAIQTNCVSRVAFRGETYLTSLSGDGRVEVEGFAADDVLLLKDNAQVFLKAAEAAWLNGCANGKAAVETAAAGLSAKEFSDAYLLNIDITQEGWGATFKITGMEVKADCVEIAVTLTRRGSIAQSINGILRFYGAATLEALKAACEPLSSQTVVDDDFSDGDTVTASFAKSSGSTTNNFFNAKIEER